MVDIYDFRKKKLKLKLKNRNRDLGTVNADILGSKALHESNKVVETVVKITNGYVSQNDAEKMMV